MPAHLRVQRRPGRPGGRGVQLMTAAVVHPAHVGPADRLGRRLPQLEPALHATYLGDLPGLDVEGEAPQSGVSRYRSHSRGHLDGLLVVNTHVLQETDVDRVRRRDLLRALRRSEDEPADGAEQQDGHRGESGGHHAARGSHPSRRGTHGERTVLLHRPPSPSSGCSSRASFSPRTPGVPIPAVTGAAAYGGGFRGSNSSASPRQVAPTSGWVFGFCRRAVRNWSMRGSFGSRRRRAPRSARRSPSGSAARTPLRYRSPRLCRDFRRSAARRCTRPARRA